MKMTLHRNLFASLAVAMIVALSSISAQADLTAYSQDFEGLNQADPAALGNDGWLVFANIFDPGGGYLYGYGPFPAPNGQPSGGFSDIASGEGGPNQGQQQLNTYSDYNNNNEHSNGNLVESNVFQEWVIGTVDIGSTWRFDFDAKLGNLGGNTTALAFIKTLDPNNGFALTNFEIIDTTNLPTTWSSHSLSLFIDPTLDGQIFQIGFANTATNFDGSGVFYDNINFFRVPEPGTTGLFAAAFAGLALVRRRRK